MNRNSLHLAPVAPKRAFASSKWIGLGLGLLAGIATVQATFSAPTSAQDSAQTRRERRRDALQDTFTGWDRLGETTVSSATSDQTITVASGADASDRIRVRVERSGLVISSFVVTYANGERYEANAELSFSGDQRSREIDLPGTPRTIARVDFHTANLPSGQSSQIEVWSR